MQVQIRLRRRRRPDGVRLPGVRARLERRGLPGKLLASAVQPIAEPRRLDLLAELERRVVPAKRDQADRLGVQVVPLAVKPRPRDDEVVAVGIALF